ncbi:hypothetical protein KR032_009500, partial [Drosophila birchii]
TRSGTRPASTSRNPEKHNRHKMQLLLLALLLAATVASGEDATAAAVARPPPPPRVKLNKCCHTGEFLNETTRACSAGSSELWVPMVYLVQQQRFFDPPGGSPRFMKFLPNSRPACSERRQELFRSRNGNVMLFPNGSLYVRERALFVDPSQYCVDLEVALVCLGQDNDQTADALEQPGPGMVAAATAALPDLRLRKCCGKFGTYDTQLKNCNLQPGLKADGQLRLAPQLPLGSYRTSYGLPECSEHSSGGGGGVGGYAIAGDWHEAKLDRATGSLRLPHTNLSAEHYCLEHTQREGEVKIIACQHLFTHEDGSRESGGTHDSLGEDNLQKAVLTGGILVSIVFLAATLVAGFMLPAVHHALHWRCQICYVFCLLVGKVLLAIEELSSDLQTRPMACLVVAIGMQFFFLAAFFWLNTMCFNIWWTFRDLRPTLLERNQEALRLCLYSLYAFGGPLLITFVAACIDQMPDTTLLRPGFGQLYCWFDNRNLSIFAYFYGPIGLLLCANIALFVSTTHQLTCGLWKRDDAKTSTEKSALGRVCLKLVVVMGLTWIAEILSWVVGGPHGAWFFTDLINALQGVFIFIVVGCQPQVYTACRRICCPRLRHDITNTTNGVQHSSSSQGLPCSMAGGGTEVTQNTSMHQCTTIVPGSSGGDSGLAEDLPSLSPPSPLLEETTMIPTLPAGPAKMETVC